MYLVVLVLALVQLEQSAKVMANLKLMQQPASLADLALEPALLEQSLKSKIALIEKTRLRRVFLLNSSLQKGVIAHN